MKPISQTVLSVVAGILLTAGILEAVRTLDIRIPEGSAGPLLLLGGLLMLGILKLMAQRET